MCSSSPDMVLCSQTLDAMHLGVDASTRTVQVQVVGSIALTNGTKLRPRSGPTRRWPPSRARLSIHSRALKNQIWLPGRDISLI